MRSSTLIWASLSTLAAAIPQGTTSTTSAPAVTHTIKAGDGNFQYDPHITYANVGDIIKWEFFPLNHSVVRAAYGVPCIPIQDEPGFTGQAFSSPLLLHNYTSNPPPSYSKRINDTNPIWFYCSTPGSCNKMGMVGVINPGPGQSFESQQNKALAAPYVLQPGQSPPSEDGSTPSPSAGSSSSSSSSSGGGGLSGGAIAGIVVGSILGLALIGALFFFVGRSKTYSDMLHGTRTHSKPAPAAAAPFDANQQMSTSYQSEDWKGPHSAMVSPSYPPPYASPEQQFSHPGAGVPGQYQNMQYQNMQGQYQPAQYQQGNRPPGLSRFSELGPSPNHQDRHIHELETPLVSPMKFDDGEDIQRR